MTLSKQIEYIPGQINKQVIIENASGKVILMAFDRDTALGTHSAPADAMVQILEGSCLFTLGDTVHTLHAGDAIVMTPGQMHSLSAPESFKMLLTLLK